MTNWRAEATTRVQRTTCSRIGKGVIFPQFGSSLLNDALLRTHVQEPTATASSSSDSTQQYRLQRGRDEALLGNLFLRELIIAYFNFSHSL